MNYLLKTFIALLFTCNMLSAQHSSFYIGGNAGLNFSKLKHTIDLSELYPTSNSLLRLNGGLVMGLQIQNFTLSTGAQYVQKGGHYETQNFEDTNGTGFFAADERTHFLSIPVLVGYRHYITDGFGVSIAMGPSFNVGLSGKIDETIEYYGSEEVSQENYVVKFGSSVNDDYNKMQVGFQVSPGMFFEINQNSHITLNLTWDNGTKDVYNQRYKQANTFFDTYKGSQFNRSTMITIGYEYHIPFSDRY